MATEKAFRLGSVGKTMIGCETKIDNPDKDGCGEILLRGRHITMGYLQEEKKTRAGKKSVHFNDKRYLDYFYN